MVMLKCDNIAFSYEHLNVQIKIKQHLLHINQIILQQECGWCDQAVKNR